MSKVRIKPNQFQTFDKNLIEAGELLELQISPIEELENLKKNSSNSFKINSIAIGKIIEKYPDHVVLDINYKSNGQINSYEFNAIEYQALIVGSEVEVLIEELENEDGQVVLSYEKAKSTKSWNRIVELYDQNKPVEGIVTSKVKGGLYVDIGINAFLPGSQIDTQRVIDFDQWIGQKIQAYIIKIIPKRGNVILSRRKYVYECGVSVIKFIFSIIL